MKISVDSFVSIAKEPFDDSNATQRKEMFIHMLVGMLFSTIGVIFGYIIILLSFVFSFIPFLGVILTGFVFLGAIVLMWIFASYIYGIRWEITKRTYKEKDKIIPKFKQEDMLKFMKTGFKVSLIDLGYNLPLIIIGIIVMTLSGLLDYVALRGSDSEGMIFSFTLMLAMIPMYLVIAILYWFIIPAAKYYYIKSNNLKDAFRFSSVIEILTKEWKSFLLYAGAMMIVSSVIGAIMMVVYPTIFLCIGFILVPIVGLLAVTYNVYFSGRTLGTIYQDLSKKGY